MSSQKVLQLDPSLYPGGIAIWGALPAIYDTNGSLPDEGVHVHARLTVGGPKCIDETFDAVTVVVKDSEGSSVTFTINGTDASDYNVATILKRRLKYLTCPQCGCLHGDHDRDAVTYHQIHTCEYCDTIFEDTEPSISNPVMKLKEICNDLGQDRPILDPVERKNRARQERYKGGIQIWGSNPAIVWTSPKLEEGGIHFHGFVRQCDVPEVDETYGEVSVDGIPLDPEMVRHLMAQRGLPYLVPFLCTLHCPRCNTAHFDRFEMATSPHDIHKCDCCGHEFATPDERGDAVSNPLVEIITKLYSEHSRLF